jgi:hypothetical protein
MAIVLALFVVVQIVMFGQVRSHLMAPERLTTTFTAGNLTSLNMFNHLTVTVDRPGAWVISQQTVDTAGRPATVPSWASGCLGNGPGTKACIARLNGAGYRQLVTYHPAGRFWTLQLYETLVYLGLAVVLAGLCLWWIRRPS